MPSRGKVLVPNNGAYCQRIIRILGYVKRVVVELPHREDQQADPKRIDTALAADPAISHVAQVRCESGTGLLNTLPEIADVVATSGKCLD